ncbi:major facilitator superfamily transporter [Colletotrichum truncatum]|uniref:Major facilitator superfamily transporter n=1 Tax=Colletotrichum truncatum TaxID=5467 RepID=A0ACC3ZCC7_COLTU|nr:major facilitator superfamily transporter [Colletotrichum truncatum]KAF6782229.1 major facilitator superfamily transporter [Colletotrichum truncatum]
MSELPVQKDDEPRVDTFESPVHQPHAAHESQAHGTVQLLQGGSVVLIPTPSPDPKDPLNLPKWHKYLIILVVGSYSAIAVLVTSGLGAVFPSVLKEYPPEEAGRATDLLTYPTLFMGIGNLFSMPLCVTIGRRPVFLASLVLMVVSGIWCAFSGSLSSHIAGRNFYSIAAGQSEALAPFIIEEIHFLHERSAKLSWFIGVQTVGTAGMFVATAYIVPAWGTKWWYIIVTLINAAILVLAFFFAVETKYNRPKDADRGAVHLKLDDLGNVCNKGDTEMVFQVTTRENHVLQPEVFGNRTWRSDLRIFHFKPEWRQTLVFYKETFQSLCLPNIVWMLLINGTFLGIYIYQASTFATILMSPPYSFQSEWLGYVQLVQVLDCVIMVPLLGYGSDILARMMSTWKNGIFQPEYRLVILSIPIASAIVACILYGQAGANPESWHWMAIVAPYHVGYFAFLGANLIGITYAIDSFPSKAGPLLLVICAGRGFISFGLSYSTVPLINLTGYNGAMNIFAIISGVLGAITIPVYFWGARIRMWATRKLWPELAQ